MSAKDNRRDPRAKILSLTVRYKSATVADFIEHHSYDISRGGLFIQTPAPFPAGTLLKFEVRIAQETKLIEGVGRVAFRREKARGPNKPAGMGVKFIKIADESVSLIETAIATHGEQAGQFVEGVADEGVRISDPPPNLMPDAAQPLRQPGSPPPAVPTLPPLAGVQSAPASLTFASAPPSSQASSAPGVRSPLPAPTPAPVSPSASAKQAGTAPLALNAHQAVTSPPAPMEAAIAQARNVDINDPDTWEEGEDRATLPTGVATLSALRAATRKLSDPARAPAPGEILARGTLGPGERDEFAPSPSEELIDSGNSEPARALSAAATSSPDNTLDEEDSEDDDSDDSSSDDDVDEEGETPAESSRASSGPQSSRPSQRGKRERKRNPKKKKTKFRYSNRPQSSPSHSSPSNPAPAQLAPTVPATLAARAVKPPPGQTTTPPTRRRSAAPAGSSSPLPWLVLGGGLLGLALFAFFLFPQSESDDSEDNPHRYAGTISAAKGGALLGVAETRLPQPTATVLLADAAVSVASQSASVAIPVEPLALPSASAAAQTSAAVVTAVSITPAPVAVPVQPAPAVVPEPSHPEVAETIVDKRGKVVRKVVKRKVVKGSVGAEETNAVDTPSAAVNVSEAAATPASVEATPKPATPAPAQQPAAAPPKPAPVSPEPAAPPKAPAAPPPPASPPPQPPAVQAPVAPKPAAPPTPPQPPAAPRAPQAVPLP